MIRRIALIAVVAVLSVASGARAEEGGELGREEIETIVREYIAEHPEIVVEALQEWQRRAAVAEADAAAAAVESQAAALYDDPETPFAGNPEGDVVIVEFFDYRCGYCRHSAPDLFALIESDPGVKVVFKEFPILGEGSRLAARAALASRAQGLYYEFHRALMSTDIDFGEESIMAVAASVGLDTARLKEDMQDPAIDAYLAKTDELAGMLAIRGTPAFVIGGELFPGALDAEDFAQVVAAARAE